MCCCQQARDGEALMYSIVVYNDRIHKTGMSTCIHVADQLLFLSPRIGIRVAPGTDKDKDLKVVNSTSCIECPEVSL